MTDANPPAPPSNPPKPRLFRPAFVVVASVLLVAALSLTTVVQALELHFKKLPVELDKPLLLAIPPTMGTWVQASVDEPMGKELEEALGTENYITRWYLNREALGDLVPDNINELNGEQLTKLLGEALQANPEAVVKLHMAYYTGSVDTVPHIPDRCMVAGGYDPVDPRPVTWNVLPLHDGDDNGDDSGDDTKAGEFGPTKLRFVEFRDRDITEGGPVHNVAYFFQVNGDYEHDPITGVRARLMSLTETHAYFCKIELMCISADPDAAQAGMENFLQNAMPSIEAALPDWDKIIQADHAAAAAPNRSDETSVDGSVATAG